MRLKRVDNNKVLIDASEKYSFYYYSIFDSNQTQNERYDQVKGERKNEIRRERWIDLYFVFVEERVYDSKRYRCIDKH